MDELTGLRARIVAGEPLDSRELDALGRATAHRPGERAWLVCFSQALVNSDRAQQAIVLLNAAADATPDDFDVLLTRARAALALGRLDEAEGDLDHALRQRPEDPEAARVRAAIDAGRASAGLATHGDLEPLAPSAQCTCATYVRRLLTALERRGVAARADLCGDTLHVRLGQGRCGHLSISDLVQSCSAAPDRAEQHLAMLAQRLSTCARGGVSAEEFASMRARLYPLLRTRAWLDRTGPALHEKAGADGLVWLYALDEGEFLRTLEPDFPARSGIDVAAIGRAALQNLDGAALRPARYRLGLGGLVHLDDDAKDWDLVAWERGDGFDASRPLAPQHWAQLEALHDGPWAMAIPATAYCLLAPVERAEAVAFLGALARAEGAGEEGLSDVLYCVRAGGIELLRAPAT